MTSKQVTPNTSTGTGIKPAGKLYLSRTYFLSAHALDLYQYVKLSLLDVNNWNSHRSGPFPNARLMDQYGYPVGRIGRVGDRIKITFPHWQSALGMWEWFEIRKIEERLHQDIEFFFVTLAPCLNPNPETQDGEFISHDMSITLFVILDERKIDLQIHMQKIKTGRASGNGKSPFKKILHALIMHGGIYKKQWGKLIKSLLADGAARLTNLN